MKKWGLGVVAGKLVYTKNIRQCLDYGSEIASVGDI